MGARHNRQCDLVPLLFQRRRKKTETPHIKDWKGWRGVPRCRAASVSHFRFSLPSAKKTSICWGGALLAGKASVISRCGKWPMGGGWAVSRWSYSRVQHIPSLEQHEGRLAAWNQRHAANLTGSPHSRGWTMMRFSLTTLKAESFHPISCRVCLKMPSRWFNAPATRAWLVHLLLYWNPEPLLGVVGC